MRATYEKCIDCGKPKTTKWQQRVPRCYKCGRNHIPDGRPGHYYTHCIDCGKEKPEPNEYPRCKSCSKKLLWEDKEFQEKQRAYRDDPDYIRQERETHVAIWADPEKRKKQRQTQLESWSAPELKAKHSNTLKKSYEQIFKDKERYDAVCAHLAKYTIGQVTWLDTDYGDDFNTWLKQQIRRRDNYKCVLCGKSESDNNRHLDCHHINYDKRDSRPENLVALCRKCHLKTNKSRPYWQTFFAITRRPRLQDWQHRAIMSSGGWTPIE